LLDGQNEVLTTTGIETANGRQDRPKADLVSPYPGDQKGCQPGTECGAERADHDRLASRASWRAICWTSFGTDRLSSSSGTGFGAGGIGTRSRPLTISWRVRRKASRYNRRRRFRSVAEPIFRETDRPTRRNPRPFSQPYTISQSSLADRRRS